MWSGELWLSDAASHYHHWREQLACYMRLLTDAEEHLTWRLLTVMMQLIITYSHSVSPSGSEWTVRRWSRALTPWSQPTARLATTVSSSQTCCCSAARAPTRRCSASAPVATTWRARWRCARTAYSSSTRADRRRGSWWRIGWGGMKWRWSSLLRLFWGEEAVWTETFTGPLLFIIFIVFSSWMWKQPTWTSVTPLNHQRWRCESEKRCKITWINKGSGC